jgi:predicted metal-dependent hydrolase
LTCGAKAGFLRGIAEFNRGEFFQAHETWERLWLGASGSEKQFLQAVIQIAAAFHHWSRGNSSGTLSLLLRANAALVDFPRTYEGIQLGRFRRETSRWVEILDRGGAPRVLPRIQSVTLLQRKSSGRASHARN